jgi:beta-glucanase (GH16 family)
MPLTPKIYNIPDSPNGGVVNIQPVYFKKASATDKPVTPAGAQLIDIPNSKFGGVLALEETYTQNPPPPPPAPTVTISQEPTGASGEISWTTTGDVTSTAIAVDSAQPVPVTGNTYAYTNLVPGPHTIIVSVEGPGGGDTTSATWTVPPTVTYLFDDEFNGAAGSAPDPTKWTYDLGPWPYNGEIETYTNNTKNVQLDGNGHLVITALHDNTGDPTHPYTSARLKTIETFKYGRIDVSAKVPVGQGLWPSAWATAESIWPAGGELDLFEILCAVTTTAYQTAHGAIGNTENDWSVQVVDTGTDFSQAFHVYSVDWTEGQVQFLLDGVVTKTIVPADVPAGGEWPFDSTPGLNILLNLAIGGTWGGPPNAATVFPASVEYDYVRVTPVPMPPPSNPTITITAQPSGSTGSISWKTTGTVTATTATLDSQAVTVTGNSYSFSNVAVGSHTFIVTVEPGGASATAAWTVSPAGAYQPTLPSNLASLVNANDIIYDYNFATLGEPQWGKVWNNSWFGGQSFNGKANFDTANISFTSQGMVFSAYNNGYIGAMVNSDLRQNSQGFQYQYAYVEALLNCPADANWFTFWTAAQGDPNGGENDIIEFDGPNAWTSNYHSGGTSSNNVPGPQYPGQWIKYGLLATPSTYYVIWNGSAVRSYQNLDGGAQHYLLFSSGTAGAFTASNSPTTIGRVTVWALA